MAPPRADSRRALARPLALGLLTLLLLLAPSPTLAEKSAWVDGMPPVRFNRPLGIEGARFAELEPCPGLEATLYLVEGQKNGEPYSMLMIDSERGLGFHSLPRPFVEGREGSVSVSISYSDVPVREVPLTLRRLSRSSIEYEWSEPVPIGAISLGESFPSLKARGLDRRRWDSTELRGRVAVLNSWATWCIPCNDEIPDLNGLVEEFHDQPSVSFVAISPESGRLVEKHLAEHPFAFLQLVSAESIEVFGRHYPRHVVVDVRGHVVFDHVGWSPDIADRLREAIRGALAAPSESGPGVEP